MRFLDCNKSTAMDYIYALNLIENHIVQSRVRFLTREKTEFHRPGDKWSGDLRPIDRDGFQSNGIRSPWDVS